MLILCFIETSTITIIYCSSVEVSILYLYSFDIKQFVFTDDKYNITLYSYGGRS